MGNGNTRDPLVSGAAIVILIAFAGLIIYLLGKTTSSESEWTRSVYLLTGVESVAFAAAGFLFGREVHRERAEKAENRANKAAGEAAEAHRSEKETQAKGRVLAEVILARTMSSASVGVESDASPVSSDLAEIARLAQEFFPPATPQSG